MAGSSFPALSGPWLEQLRLQALRLPAHGAAQQLVAALRQEPGQSPRAARLADTGTVAVVTGQQPAVGGGPLYTLIKAAHAIALAERLSRDGQPCVAVFWCASEDHDLGEAGHADCVLRSGRVARFAPGLGGGHASLRFRPAAAWHAGWLAHLRTHLGPGLGEAFLTAQAPLPDEGLGAWLNRLLGAVFGEGLLRVESFRLRGLWTDMARRALRAWPVEALHAQRARLLSDGAVDAFGELPQAPFFADEVQGRRKLTTPDAAELLERDPGLLSPGAAIRPILQQAALPAVAYVGGDGELAYHAFLTPLYAALGAPAPLLVPRLHTVLAPSWLARALAAWQVEVPDLIRQAQAPTLAMVQEPATAFLADLDRVLAALTALTPDHRFLSGHVRRLAHARDGLARGMQKELRHHRGLTPYGQLRGYVLPRDQPQERVMSLCQALWEHGPGLGQRLVQEASGHLGGGTSVLSLV